MMTTHEKLVNLNDIFGIWQVNDFLRVTYVSQCWLIVWDHRQHPPVRHDCKARNHQLTCAVAAEKLQELAPA